MTIDLKQLEKALRHTYKCEPYEQSSYIRNIHEAAMAYLAQQKAPISDDDLLDSQLWQKLFSYNTQKMPEQDGQKSKWQGIDGFYDDPIEDIAHALAVECEQAELKASDYVTVNREKLKGIAQRIFEKAQALTKRPAAPTVAAQFDLVSLKEESSLFILEKLKEHNDHPTAVHDFIDHLASKGIIQGAPMGDVPSPADNSQNEEYDV